MDAHLMSIYYVPAPVLSTFHLIYPQKQPYEVGINTPDLHIRKMGHRDGSHPKSCSQ